MRAGPLNSMRCRTRLFPPAWRFETNWGSVCRSSGTNNQFQTPCRPPVGQEIPVPKSWLWRHAHRLFVQSQGQKQISCWKCKGYILLWLTLLVLHTQAAQEWCEFEILLLSWAFLLGQPHQPPFERRNRNGLWRPITQVKICNLRL